MDIVLERAKQGLCPICKCKIEKDTPRVDMNYNGEKVIICFKHYKPNLK